ncbi:hypothetical protein PAPYR_1382 [Paratrimastix pyriformis]|uniref:PH domain-containing protein n=1 Tax=Paratrimastix pyriformis TaxID=342808 RepID=A0ABQ8UVQ2_9EUKA|nr:hypothetical protein PAPYR_1382 [Paratrimastix pyriformis]
MSLSPLKEKEKEGWIFKEGGIFTTWKRRWLVIRVTGEVLYFDTDTKTQAHDVFKGSFLLQGANLVRPKDTQTPRGWEFDVQTSTRTYKFACPTQEETDEWVSAFNIVISLVNAGGGRLIPSGMGLPVPVIETINRVIALQSNLGRVQLEFSRCTAPARQLVLRGENDILQIKTLPPLFMQLASGIASAPKELIPNEVRENANLLSQVTREYDLVLKQSAETPATDTVRLQQLGESNLRLCTRQQRLASELCATLQQLQEHLIRAQTNAPVTTSSPSATEMTALATQIAALHEKVAALQTAFVGADPAKQAELNAANQQTQAQLLPLQLRLAQLVEGARAPLTPPAKAVDDSKALQQEAQLSASIIARYTSTPESEAALRQQLIQANVDSVKRQQTYASHLVEWVRTLAAAPAMTLPVPVTVAPAPAAPAAATAATATPAPAPASTPAPAAAAPVKEPEKQPEAPKTPEKPAAPAAPAAPSAEEKKPAEPAPEAVKPAAEAPAKPAEPAPEAPKQPAEPAAEAPKPEPVPAPAEAAAPKPEAPAEEKKEAAPAAPVP